MPSWCSPRPGWYSRRRFAIPLCITRLSLLFINLFCCYSSFRPLSLSCVGNNRTFFLYTYIYIFFFYFIYTSHRRTKSMYFHCSVSNRTQDMTLWMCISCNISFLVSQLTILSLVFTFAFNWNWKYCDYVKFY